MALVDLEHRAVSAKIVYVGPARSGKTTNLRVLHTLLGADHKGQLTAVEDPDGSTLFFDYFPILAGDRGGFEITLRMFTVSGQEARVDARRAVLAGVDGIVFVADTSAGREQENAQSMTELVQTLAALQSGTGRTIPVVIQYNKLDLEDSADAVQLPSMLNSSGYPEVFASALEERGVAETFEIVLAAVLASI